MEFKGVKIPYTINKTYNPDFTMKVGDKVIYIEVKGYFQDSTESAKYNWVKEILGPNEELIFVFDNPKTKLHYLRARVDGTKMNMAEWAEKNGFRYFTVDTFREEFL